RGRVSAIMGLSFFGVLPFSGLLTSKFADLVGLRVAMTTAGVLFGFSASAMLYTHRRVCIKQPAPAAAEPTTHAAGRGWVRREILAGVEAALPEGRPASCLEIRGGTCCTESRLYTDVSVPRLREQLRHRRALVRDRHGALAIHEALVRVHTQRGADCGEEIG